MAEKKIFLLDTNVLVGYYLKQNPSVMDVVGYLKKLREGGACLLFIPNFCIAEVFSTFSKLCYYRDISEKEFKEAKENFINDVSRDDEYKRYQYYNHYELNRYHLFDAHMVYQPFWEYVVRSHIEGKHKTKEGYRKFPSSFDLLTIAQGIELTMLYSDEDFAILTSDQFIIDICNYLRRLKDKDKISFIKRKEECSEHKNLSKFEYPRVLDARNIKEIKDFLNDKNST